MNNADDATGYKSPPKRYRFTKGQSGNPKGRPKGSKNFTTLIHEELQQFVVVQENGTKKKIRKADAIVKQLTTKALKGDIRILTFLVKLFDGHTNPQDENTINVSLDQDILNNFLNQDKNNGK